MAQEIINNEEVQSQLNAANIEGDVYLVKRSRFSTRFEKLKREVANDSRYEGIMHDFKYYVTTLDGVDMPTKLGHGGFNESEIIEATRKKEKYAKKQEINRFFESAQWIDSQLFAKIKMNFYTYVRPVIIGGGNKEAILKAVVEKVIVPVIDLINAEGEHDEVLNYSEEDIYGMVYYLTGTCHINWKDYDGL